MKKYVIIAISVLLVGVVFRAAAKYYLKNTEKYQPEVAASPQAREEIIDDQDVINIRNLFSDQENEEKATASPRATTTSYYTKCWIEASATAGAAPLSVTLTYFADYNNPNINVAGIAWDFDGNFTWDTHMGYDNAQISHTFNHGEHNVRMKVGFSDGSETEPCSLLIKAN